MRYASAAAFRAALEQRLRTQARERNVPVGRLRKLVVFECLLTRLLIVAPERWVLKGALALDFRLGAQSRATKDMDLARQDSERLATADFLAARSVDVGDHFTFSIERTGRLGATAEGSAGRYHVLAELAGRPFEQAIVDVGFGEPLVFPPESLTAPDLLSFAGIAPIVVPVLSLEQQVAEKLHAYTRRYAGARESTRVKDLIDLVLIAAHARVEADRLRQAVDMVFGSRGAHSLPATLPSPPQQWSVAYRKLATEVGLNPDILAGKNVAGTFLNPILAATVPDSARWDPDACKWQPGGDE